MQDATSEDNGSQRVTLLADPHHSKADMRLIRRAIENGWNVPAEVKKEVVDDLRLIVMAGQDEKNRISAAKTLIAADASDLRFQMAAEKPEAKPTEVNVQVNNIVGQPVPITESERVAEAMAILERARERAITAAVRTEADEVRPAQADITPGGVPETRMP